MTTLNDTDRDYKKTIVVHATPEEVFRALTKEISSWWGMTDRNISGAGEVFTVSWGKPYYQFLVTEYDPPFSLQWKCIDSRQIIKGLDGVEKEWVGTSIQWNIRQLGPKIVEINFVHKGLMSDFICYEICSSTWDDFLSRKLKVHLERVHF